MTEGFSTATLAIPTDPASWPALPDLRGRTWRHPDGRHLLHWLSRRNALLRTIAAAGARRGTADARAPLAGDAAALA
jgi:hypothetical protein